MTFLPHPAPTESGAYLAHPMDRQISRPPVRGHETHPQQVSCLHQLARLVAQGPERPAFPGRLAQTPTRGQRPDVDEAVVVEDVELVVQDGGQVAVAGDEFELVADLEVLSGGAGF